jgi:phage shock protein PspC (stress-responsive transcriptional regulator)
MSDLAAIVLIMVIGLAHFYVFILLDRMRKERENEIITGVIGGVAVSTRYRWLSLYTSWISPATMQLGISVLMVIVYLVMAENVDDEGVRLVAYSVAFFGSIGVLGSLMMSALGYVHLASVVRQAESD